MPFLYKNGYSHIGKNIIFAFLTVKDKNMSAPAPPPLHDILRYDDVAVKLLFEHYYVPLVIFAKNYLSDIEDCKDVVQGIFLHLIENREKFTSVDNLKAYLYQTTHNRCLKHLRHEGVKQRYVFESQSIEEEAFYLDHVLEEEVYIQLIQAIDSLPGQCRKVFRLVLENKSNQEIAETLSISVETVKSYKKQGKALLYKRLKGIVPLVLLTSWLQF